VSALRSILVLNTEQRSETLRSILAIDLLHRFRLVQSVLVIDRTSLDDLHTWCGSYLDPHDRAARGAVVVCHVLIGYQKQYSGILLAGRSYLSRIAFASERAIGAGELFVLCLCQC